MNTDIHDALTSLETQLSALKSAADHIGASAAAAQSVVGTVDAILDEFRTSTGAIRAHHEEQAKAVTAHVTESVDTLVASHTQQISTVGALLAQADDLAKRTSTLIDTVRSVDFPVRFAQLEKELRASTANVEHAIAGMDVPAQFSRVQDGLNLAGTKIEHVQTLITSLQGELAGVRAEMLEGLHDANTERQRASEAIDSALNRTEKTLHAAVQESQAKLESTTAQRFNDLQKLTSSRANTTIMIFSLLSLVQIVLLVLLYLR